MEKRLPTLYERVGECCGCSACYSICPTGAISMIEDKEGFLYPRINPDECIGCQSCVRVCDFKKDNTVRSL